ITSTCVRTTTIITRAITGGSITPKRHRPIEPTGQPESIRIAPASAWARIELRELWNYRELLYFLTWRDLKVHYKQTALGAAWAVIQPLFMMIVFSVFFGRLARIPSDGVPYPVFTLFVLWWFFFCCGGCCGVGGFWRCRRSSCSRS